MCVNVSSAEQMQKYVIGHWSGGLGVCFHSVLNHICYCEHTQQTPVVYWGSDSLYYTPEGFNGYHENGWDYYFEPISSLRYEKGDTINYYVQNVIVNFNYHALDEEHRNQAHELIQKYIKPNSIVQSKIDKFYNEHLANKKTIGIHIRGTDKVIEEKPVSAHRMVQEALKYADEETQFFIATDEKKILNELITLLADRKVIYYECARSEDGQPLHQLYSKHRQTRVAQKTQVAQNGEDVVIEMILLSKCTVFLHTLSNVSAVPLYFNPSLEHVTLK